MKQILLRRPTLLTLLFILILTASGHADQFTISGIYLQDYMKNDSGTSYRFHGPGLNASFFREGKLDLLFSVSAGIPLLLTENGESHISYDYYSFPASFQLLAGPVWTLPMGETLSLEPSLGLQAGFINLKGTGYSTLQFAPFGIGGELRLKARLKPRLTLGLLAGFNWNLLDLMHYSEHETGYSLIGGISAGFSYDSGRVARQRRNGE